MQHQVGTACGGCVSAGLRQTCVNDPGACPQPSGTHLIAECLRLRLTAFAHSSFPSPSHVNFLRVPLRLCPSLFPWTGRMSATPLETASSTTSTTEAPRSTTTSTTSVTRASPLPLLFPSLAPSLARARSLACHSQSPCLARSPPLSSPPFLPCFFLFCVPCSL